MSEAPIRNRVAESNLLVIDMEEFFPSKDELYSLDISEGLEQGMFLRETTFRKWLKEKDLSIYLEKYVAILCSSDAIIPPWAYMLSATALQDYATLSCVGSEEQLQQAAFLYRLKDLSYSTDYKNAKVMIKGCSKNPLSAWAYVELTTYLLPHVASLMYGEPCSTVPIYKRANKHSSSPVN